jgi:4a-hydroxytetrahydrobiopterin dehydratase
MPGDLADQKTVPSKSGTPPLRLEQIQPLLAQLEGWRVEEGKRLIKTYRFKNFVEAVRFVNALTPVAEEQGHHPDLYVTWGEVKASLSTHSIGGLSESDFSLAAKLDRVYQDAGKPA